MTETTEIEYVSASWRDLNELRTLEQECFGKEGWPLWDIIAVLTLPGILRYKAVYQERMVGFIAAEARSTEDVGWITTVGVLPAYRQKGIATHLLAMCEQEINRSRMRLCVRRSNESALRLYRKLGYRAVDLWARYYEDGEDSFVLEKTNLSIR